MANDTFKLIDWVHWIWSEASSLDTQEAAVMTLLARRADSDGACYPGIGSIASDTKVSRSKVIRSLAKLEELGLVRRARQKRGNGFERNLYDIALTPPGSVSKTPPLAGTSVSQTPPVVSQGHLGSVSQTPEVFHEVFQSSHPERHAPKSTRSRSQRRTPSRPIAEDWKPLDRHQAKARELGLECGLVAEKFRNHALQNDRRCVQWDRAFDNWLLTERAPKAIHAPQRGLADRVQVNTDLSDLGGGEC